MTLPLGKFERFGMVVADLEPAMTAFARIFGIRQFDLCELAGRRAALGGFGSLRLELLEGTPGTDVCGEFFGRRGQGMSHAVFLPDEHDHTLLLERAEALDVAVEADKDRLTFATRGQLGGLALVTQLTPEVFTDRRRFSYSALLPPQKLFHFGAVVRDRETAIAAYQRLLGIDDFLRMELHTGQGLMAWLDGKQVDHHAQTAFGRIGNFACELMQPGEGDGMYQRFLAAHGEGPQHYFPTILTPADFAAVRAGCAAAGLNVCFEGAFGDAMRYYYLDSAPLFGMCIEIIVTQRPDWWQSLGMSAQDVWRVGLNV
ncbi:MAG: VOC family protein [Immundisolibacter sp.]|uniref:VOC family protein n=1 Tax=Immundisolibacter sp. TaxID=1934948 RepID=UPI003EDFFADA